MNEDLIGLDSGDINVLSYDKIKSFTCSKTELEILLMLKDGKNKSYILNNLDISSSRFNAAVTDLSETGVVEVEKKDFFKNEKTENKINSSDLKAKNTDSTKESIDFLVSRFSEAIGPIAEVVAEDEISEMGENREDFPVERFAELVNLLSSQIPRTDKKKEFQKAMMLKLKNL
jgi:predicted transcriptional regulator